MNEILIRYGMEEEDFFRRETNIKTKKGLITYLKKIKEEYKEHEIIIGFITNGVKTTGFSISKNEIEII